MMSEWRPVEDGEIQNATNDVLEVYTTELGTQELMSHTDAGVTTYPLPDNYRLCERIPDAPISAEALDAEGWDVVSRWDNKEGKVSDMAAEFGLHTVIVSLDFNAVHVNYNGVFGDESMRFDNVRNMADLRTLVRLLSGGSE